MKQQRIQRRKAHPKKIITKCKLNARAALDLFFLFFPFLQRKGWSDANNGKIHHHIRYCGGSLPPNLLRRIQLLRLQNFQDLKLKSKFWVYIQNLFRNKVFFYISIYLLQEKFYFPSHLNFSAAGVNLLKISILKVKINQVSVFYLIKVYYQAHETL